MFNKLYTIIKETQTVFLTISFLNLAFGELKHEDTEVATVEFFVFEIVTQEEEPTFMTLNGEFGLFPVTTKERLKILPY